MFDVQAETNKRGRRLGRYVLYDPIASGGMAKVHLGRLVGAAGFARVVAVKRLHDHFAEDPQFVASLLDEARIAARIRHPNVVATLDVLNESDELVLVLEYVHGETLARLLAGLQRRGERMPWPIATAIVAGALHGLHAAHTATSEQGEPLGIVHRDVSPQNVIVGVDGLARVLDFGVAKAIGRLQSTAVGQLKGKLAYMAPEQLSAGEVGAHSDVYAAGVVLWEALTGKRLFVGADAGELIGRVLSGVRQPPREFAPELPEALDRAVMRALALRPEERFATARELAAALEAVGELPNARAVGDWVEHAAAETLAERARHVAEIEQDATGSGQLGSGPRLKAELEPAASGSQISSVSVTTSTGARARRSPRTALVLAAALIVAGGAVIASLLAPRDVSRLDTAGPVIAARIALIRAELGKRTAAATEPSEPTEPTELLPPKPPAPTPGIRKPPRAPSKPARCNPPYVVGADGIQRLKPECL